MRAKEGLNQGIRLKFCPQGRVISLASNNYFYNLLSHSLDTLTQEKRAQKRLTLYNLKYITFHLMYLIYLFAHANPTFLGRDKVGIGGD